MPYLKQYANCMWPHQVIILGKQESDRNAQEDPVTVDAEMQNCEAYDIIQLSQLKVTMKDNPAYVDVNLISSAY